MCTRYSRRGRRRRGVNYKVVWVDGQAFEIWSSNRSVPPSLASKLSTVGQADDGIVEKNTKWTRAPTNPLHYAPMNSRSLISSSTRFQQIIYFFAWKKFIPSLEISYCTQMVLSKIRSGSIKRRRRKREERIVSKRIFGVQQATAKSRFNVIAWPCATVVSASRQPWTMRSLEGKVEVLLSGFFNQRKGWFVDIVERIA